jgi:hypothetical protein
MKKSLVFILSLLILSTISAVEINMQEEYPQSGAILSEITGSFQETLKESDISFYRKHIKVPMDFDLVKLDTTYYLFVNLKDKNTDNYSIVLENVQYLKAGKVVEEDISRNFTITDQVADFTINKGFVMTEEDFTISIQNLQDKNLDINYDFIESGKIENIYPGEIRKVSFSIQDAELLQIQILKLSSNSTIYEIPVYILDVPKEQMPSNFSFDKKELNITLDLNNETKKTIYLSNNGEEKILQIRLTLSEELEKYIQMSREEFTDVDSEFLYPLELFIFSDALPRTVEGNILAKSGVIEQRVNITLNFRPGFVSEQFSEKSCSDLGGKSCANSNNCEGEFLLVSGRNCCLGNCASTTSEEGGFSWSIVGWILLVIVILAVSFFYFKRYRNAKAPLSGARKLLEEPSKKLPLKEEFTQNKKQLNDFINRLQKDKNQARKK